MSQLKVLGISGSLRHDSTNRKLLQIAKSFATELGAVVTEADLKELNLPIYDGDIETAGIPESVQKLKKMVEESDVIMLASPEYNYSISGALKNAIDWLSRGEKNSLDNKVVVMFGASGGNFGTVRGQNHLRQILSALNVMMVTQPQVLVRNNKEAFDDKGNLVDPKTVDLLKALIKKNLDLAQKLKS